jgi:hypothetical protein
MVAHSRLLVLLAFAGAVVGDGAWAQPTLPLELERTISLGVTPAVWDVMPTWHGVYYWVAAVASPADSSRIYWGRTDLSNVDSFSVGGGAPTFISGFFRANYEPHVVLAIRHYGPRPCDWCAYSETLTCRIYRLTDGVPDSAQWVYQSSEYYGVAHGEHNLVNGFAQNLAIAVPQPPDVTVSLSAVVSRYEYDWVYLINYGHNGTAQRRAWLLVNMFAGTACRVAPLYTPQYASPVNQVSATLWNGSLHVGSRGEVTFSTDHSPPDWAGYRFESRAHRLDDSTLSNVVHHGAGSDWPISYRGFASGYDMLHDRYVQVEDMATRCEAWAAGDTTPTWSVARSYSFLLQAYAIDGEASEQVLGYDPASRAFDVMDIATGNVLARTSPLDSAFNNVICIGRYHRETLRLAARYGSEIRIYRFGSPVATQNWPERPIATEVALFPTFPNPFNAATTITYSLPRAGQVSLRVFDLLGREVAVLKDGFSAAGTYRIMFDGSALASGIYFARLDAGRFSETKKLVVMK